MTEGLPEGWAVARVGDVIELKYGKSLPAKARDAEGEVDVFGSSGVVGKHSIALVKGPVIIVGRKGTAGAVSYSRSSCWPIDTTYFVEPKPVVATAFAYHLLRSLRLQELDRSTAIPGLNRDDAYALPILLPPLAEQHRIVDKIETLFAQIDKGEEAVRQVQTLLKRYRQSVLKAAVTGELTADWRAAREGQLEHGRDLVSRILKSREDNWQGRGKYKPPVEPVTTGLPDLPEGWVWASVDQLSSAVDYGSSAKCGNDSSGVPVLRMGNIQDGELSFENLKYLPVDHGEFPNLLLHDGDMLFNRTNSAELVGKTAVYRNDGSPCSYASYLIRVKLSQAFPELVAAFINSVFGRAWVRSVVSQQVGQANVNGSKLKALAVPLGPLEEQAEIVDRLAEENSRHRVLEKWCVAELTRSAALRQSILKDAFSGKLVHQDPADEPASALLDRIRQKRSA